VRWLFVATPAYLKKRGRPRSPDELNKHDLVLFGPGGPPPALALSQGGQTVQVGVSPRLVASDMDVLLAAVLANQGLGLLPAFTSMSGLTSGRLERLLRDWDAPSAPVHVVYPSTRHLSPKVKSFVDHLQQRMTPPPWELGPAP
jgi:DNA-binding transcriptional LysR family regulator